MVAAEAITDPRHGPASGVQLNRRLHLVRSQALTSQRDAGPSQMLGHRLPADAPALRHEAHVIARLALLNDLLDLLRRQPALLLTSSRRGERAVPGPTPQAAQDERGYLVPGQRGQAGRRTLPANRAPRDDDGSHQL